MENNKPMHLLVLKIIGIVCVFLGIVGFILLITGFGDFSNNNFMIGGFMMCVGMFAGITCLSAGFKPELTRLKTKTTKYIQEENKEDLTDIVSNTADISSEAIKTVTKSIKSGMQDTMFCKHCGKEIDADSKFCNKCGKEQ